MFICLCRCINGTRGFAAGHSVPSVACITVCVHGSLCGTSAIRAVVTAMTICLDGLSWGQTLNLLEKSASNWPRYRIQLNKAPTSAKFKAQAKVSRDLLQSFVCITIVTAWNAPSASCELTGLGGASPDLAV